MATAIFESVPNFSIGKDIETVKLVANTFQSIEGLQLLHVDTDKDANRTVYTLLGEKKELLQGFKEVMPVIMEKVNMQQHQGVHPRIGACDVCPFIPFKEATKQDAIALSKEVAQLFWDKFKIPSYLYGWSAQTKHRISIANCRYGEYEGLQDKLVTPEGKPDVGDAVFSSKYGLSIIGARDFLIAYNINIEGVNAKTARLIAGRLRASGILIKENGEYIRNPGRFGFLQARAWFLEERKQMQITTNVLDYKENSLFSIYRACQHEIGTYGGKVTSSHVVGMLPLAALQQKETSSLPIEEQVKHAITELGLDLYDRFVPSLKILEFAT